MNPASPLDETRRAAERLRLVVEFSPNALLIVNREGRISLVNAQTEKLFGYAREELLGQPIESLVPERFRAAHPGHRDGFFANPQSRAMGAGRDMFGLRKDGREVPIEIGLNPITTGEGTFVLASVIDVSERKGHEEERERLTRDLQLLLESTGEGIYGIDLAGRFTFINRAGLDLLGYRREELLGRNAHAVIHHTRNDGAPYPVEECPIFRAFRTTQGCRRDDEALWRKDGTSFPSEYASYPILQAGGCEGAVVTFRDITERKRAEAQLREAHDQLETRVRERTAELASINESLRAEIAHRQQAEAVMTGDQEVLGLIAAGRPLSNILETLARNLEAQTSGALCSILLLDADGVHLRHGAAPSLPEAYNRAIDGMAIGPGVGSCGTAAYLRQQIIVADIATDPLWANFKALALRHGLRACWSTPIQSAAGRVLGTFAMYDREPRRPAPKDFATIDRATYLAGIAIERKQGETALQEAHDKLESKVLVRTAQLEAKNDELKGFAYTVSHDLKAPLRGINGYAQELERRHKAGLPERARFCIAQIITATKNLDCLIEDLLKYSRLDAETPTLTDVPLAELVQRILHDRSHTLTEFGVELTINLPPLALRTWERGFHQVLANLVDNAIKYSRKSAPPRVTITAEERPASNYQPSTLILAVADNGIGFDMKYHDRIFGLFNRLVRAGEFEGTGAGLAIVKKLMDKLGGTIRAESAPGQGATFYVTLPI